MRHLLAVGLLMTPYVLLQVPLRASRTHSTRHSKNYSQYSGSNGQYSGHFSRNYGISSQYQYYGSPNNRGGLVGGDDDGT